MKGEFGCVELKKCKICGQLFQYRNEDTFWDYSGYTPTKLVRCTNCNKLMAIKYTFESNPNLDLRYYSYAKKKN